VIPVNLRSHMLNLIHESYFGMEKCKAKARQLVYWPRMTVDNERTISACDTCAQFQRSPQRESMIPHSIPTNRFEKVAMDIMTWCVQDYLVVFYYYSKYPELLPLQDKTTKTIVEHTKSVCACPSLGHKSPHFQSHFFSEQWPSRIVCANVEAHAHQIPG